MNQLFGLQHRRRTDPMIIVQNSSSNPFVNSFNAHKISTIKHILPR